MIPNKYIFKKELNKDDFLIDASYSRGRLILNLNTPPHHPQSGKLLELASLNLLESFQLHCLDALLMPMLYF